MFLTRRGAWTALAICMIVPALYFLFAWYYSEPFGGPFSCKSGPPGKDERDVVPSLRMDVGLDAEVNRTTACDFHYRGKVFPMKQTFDAFGRRLTPQGGPGPYRSFLAIFGGSTVFGWGVSDDETVPAQLAKLNPQVEVLNYGGLSAGNHQNLRRLETLPLAPEIPERDGTGLVFFHSRYLARARGGFCYFVQNRWQPLAPSYRVGEDGEATFDGPLGAKVRLSSFFASVLRGQAPVWNFCMSRQLHEFDTEGSYSEEDFRYMGAILSGLHREFLKQVPRGKFAVVLFVRDHALARRFQEFLALRNIISLDYSESKWMDYHGLFGHWDRQQSVELAGQLKRDLHSLGAIP